MRGLLTVTASAQARTAAAFDPDRGWRLHPQVAVRPEPFGALLYHFGTRKLSFLKNRTILAVVNRWPTTPTPGPPAARPGSRTRSRRLPACARRAGRVPDAGAPGETTDDSATQVTRCPV